MPHKYFTNKTINFVTHNQNPISLSFSSPSPMATPTPKSLFPSLPHSQNQCEGVRKERDEFVGEKGNWLTYLLKVWERLKLHSCESVMMVGSRLLMTWGDEKMVFEDRERWFCGFWERLRRKERFGRWGWPWETVRRKRKKLNFDCVLQGLLF